jgi:hypothetical protein
MISTAADSRVTVEPVAVSRTMPNAGPIAKDSSTLIESREKPACRSAGGTIAASACRVREKIGMASRPPTTAAGSSAA